MPVLGDKFHLANRYKHLNAEAWDDFLNLMSHDDTLDLDIGYPDFSAQQHIAFALSDVAKTHTVDVQQYSRDKGSETLVNVLAKMYSKLLNRTINPLTEIIITAGAYEALYCSVLAHINPGDEVILIEPFFYCFPDIVAAAGGKSVFVPLRPVKKSGIVKASDWVFNLNELKAAFNERTKILMINTPNNPLGKVFTEDELLQIAELCKMWNVMCISDEVYEWLVFEPQKHTRIASLPGMWERTITIGSAGKVLGMTGWKIGWAYGPECLLNNFQAVHRITVKNVCTPTQKAVASIFEKELNRLNSQECSFISIARVLKGKRDYTAKFLAEIGMAPVIPDGGIFVMVDWTPFVSEADLDGFVSKRKDYKFIEWMIKNYKIKFVPVSLFYSASHSVHGENYVRVCFIKKDATLQKAEEILKSSISSKQNNLL